MMLFVHSAGGVAGALLAMVWAAAHSATTEQAAGILLFGSFVGTLAGHVIQELIDDYNKKH
jgi:hypothetical protein